MSVVARAVNGAGGRVTGGGAIPGGRFKLCSACRWPFPARTARTKPVCGDCRAAEVARAVAAALAALRAAAFPGWGRRAEFLGHPPGHAGRVAEYARRAAAGLPLFGEG